MDQTVKILYLTTNQILVTELVEVAAIDIGAPDCKMVNPFILKDDQSLEPWLFVTSRGNPIITSSEASIDSTTISLAENHSFRSSGWRHCQTT